MHVYVEPIAYNKANMLTSDLGTRQVPFVNTPPLLQHIVFSQQRTVGGSSTSFLSHVLSHMSWSRPPAWILSVSLLSHSCVSILGSVSFLLLSHLWASPIAWTSLSRAIFFHTLHPQQPPLMYGHNDDENNPDGFYELKGTETIFLPILKWSCQIFAWSKMSTAATQSGQRRSMKDVQAWNRIPLNLCQKSGSYCWTHWWQAHQDSSQGL